MNTSFLITEINKSWFWLGFIAVEVIKTNDFGNIIFKSQEGEYWRLCPEELSCKLISKTEKEYLELTNDVEFIEDWLMAKLVQTAHNHLGEWEENSRYCLKIPSVLGGEDIVQNLGKIDLLELISSSGSLAYQIRDLEDGEVVELVVVG